MRGITSALMALLLIGMFSQAVLADDPQSADQPVVLEEVHVEALADQETAEGNMKTINIEDSGRTVVNSVPDVLQSMSGIDVQRRSMLSPRSSMVRIRGFDERRYEVLLNGRPLNGTGVMGGQFVDWTTLSLDHYNSIEVSKGAYSAKHGNTLGGTIELIPERPTHDPTFKTNAGMGCYETFHGSGQFAIRDDNFGLIINSGYDESDGHLRNSDFDRVSIGGSFLVYPTEKGEIEATFRYTKGDYNFPVENRKDEPDYDASYPDHAGSMSGGPGIQFLGGDTFGDESYYEKMRQELDLAYRDDWFGAHSEVIFYYNNEERKDIVYSKNTSRVAMKREAIPDRSWGFVARVNRPFETALGTHTIGVGGEGNFQGYGGTRIQYQDNSIVRASTNGSDEWDATRRYGAYVDDTWSVLDTLDLYAGVRFEHYWGDREVDMVSGYNNGRPAGFVDGRATMDDLTVLPKFGATFEPIEEVKIHAHAGRATRMPDNPMFYWYFGGYRPEVDTRVDITRKALTYEDAWQYEGGITVTPIPDLTMGVSYYYYDVDDYLRWIFGYAPSRTVYNLDNATLQGVEADIEGRIWGDFYAFANFTWQKTKKKGDVMDASNDLSDELSELPEYKANWGLKYQTPEGILAKVTFRYVGEREIPRLGDDDSDGVSLFAGSPISMAKMDSFITTDVHLKYPIWTEGAKIYLSFAAENLADEDYEEEYDLPALGRTFSGAIEMRF